MLRYHDISPEISEKSAVFPGDVPYRRTPSAGFEGGTLTLSHIESTVHIGAHADAPSHYHPKGAAIDARKLDYYVGSCQVVSVEAGEDRRIRPEHMRARVAAERLLFKTGSFPNPERWNGNFAALSPELIRALARQGVILVGIDTPSIDPSDSKALESHQAVYEKDMAVLEGLDLARVPDGLYDLIALPLRLKGADASPVRAILVQR